MKLNPDKYSRLYCGNCKLIYAMEALGHVTHCSTCGKPLTMKSFSPWPKAIGAVALIAIGLATIFVADIPIVWIGAFIWAIGLLVNGFSQWSKVKDLDSRSQDIATSSPVKEELKDDEKDTVVNCGACFHQYRVHRGKGIIKTKCPKCGREARIMT
jgi:uncharacterized CHY-type Zn-finger protein